jgi:hypothetical protein
MIDNITKSICEIDPLNKEYYEKNANNYKNEIIKLDAELENFIKNAEKKEIAVGGEFAYAYLVDRYDIDFVSVYNTWKNIIKNDDIRLVVGMTLGKAKQGFDNYAGSGKNEWSEHNDIIKRCMEFLSDKKECSGISMFCYQYMYDPLSNVSVVETKLERDNMFEIMQNLGK